MPEYTCDECGAVFQTGLALQRHKQIFHMPQDVDGASAAVTGTAGEPRLAEPVVFKCGFCGATFSQHAALREHLRQEHAAEREARARELELRLSERGARHRCCRRRARRGGVNGRGRATPTKAHRDLVSARR